MKGNGTPGGMTQQQCAEAETHAHIRSYTSLLLPYFLLPSLWMSHPTLGQRVWGKGGWVRRTVGAGGKAGEGEESGFAVTACGTQRFSS